MTLLPDHADDLRPGEEAFPHRVRSVSVKQNPHQIKKRSKGQVTSSANCGRLVANQAFSLKMTSPRAAC
ncbi:hypothetical protein H5395_06865 [Paracoccus sp. MC1854]|nr:hypothetical protein [Paracoccus sp. MC1854]MBB1491256.1 hypothetical protein [Paracoccus sp. MC1854]